MNEISKAKIFQLFDKIKNDKNTLLIVVIGFMGILLIFSSEFVSDDEEVSDIEVIKQSDFDILYKEELEQIIGKIKGVGKVDVMITFTGTSESVYASDVSEQTKSDEFKADSEHIILDKGNTEEGLLVKEIFPHVAGVAVVCEGGDSPTIKNEITLMLKALFGIGSNCISISEMNS